ncbi:DUF2085 domain-containing protein [Nitrolancea hollandica]|uniref:DUF2085 domain-containing protein n=1 Tax=Nitrolancea hollandica Lb TaxID=1129897 RepID=I4EI38_9BACT|nr:DUF2085 domain-containing protein [Nitrolancea hollandica]CCF84350.1 conserved membrane hypothetical protein [Nitrolancea hollandica Lb]
MSAIPSGTAGPRSKPEGWSALFFGLLGLSVIALLLAPWQMQDKAMAILHGLCAQRPGHSFWFGDQRLPFDARMTGIYGGFLISQLYLLVRRRLRVTRIPSLAILIALALFVVAMGIDGFNSLFSDIDQPTLYEPSNLLRYSTGALTGTTLGVALWLLASNVLWCRKDQIRRPIIRGWGELLQILTLAAIFGILAGSGWQVLYTPITLLLIVSAVMVFFTIALAFIQLARKREASVTTLGELAGPAVGALLTAYVVIAILGGGRFLLEGMLHIQPMP